MADLAHCSKSIPTPEGNLHGSIYEAGLAVSVQLLEPTEETAADMNLMGQRHRVVLRVELIVCVCVVYDVCSVSVPEKWKPCMSQRPFGGVVVLWECISVCESACCGMRCFSGNLIIDSMRSCCNLQRNFSILFYGKTIDPL